MAKPKLELMLDKKVQLTLLKDKPYIGNNSYGEFYLYTVKNEEGVEFSYFAEAPVHALIQEHKLKAGSTFILQRVATQNGKKMSSKVEFSIVGDSEERVAPASSGDGLKDLLLQCVRDAADVVREAGIQFSNDEIQKLATTLFIKRSK